MNILAVGAHYDDIELGCGGSIARLAEEGNNVYGITLTNSETHYEERNIHRTTEQAIAEAEKAGTVVGLQLIKLPYEQADNGKLAYDTELMRELEKFIVEKNVEMIFTHWQYDMNTDHAAASKISIVAARHVHNILQYRSNWYQPDRSFNGIYYIDISNHINKKIESIEAYSGEIDNRSQEWINSFIDNNRSYGFSIGVEYAEVFEPIRISNIYK
jgi:LmbE family N-acetylglucosaminyl deacetylase